MRVTGNQFNETLVRQLNVLTARQYRLQNQATTGQRVYAPEDDPSAFARAAGLRAERGENAQYAENIAALQQRASAGYNALRALQKISDRVGELATMADDTRSPEELRVYATEVTELIQQAAQWLNSQHQGQYLFAGTAAGAPPFSVTTDAEGQVTAVAYAGNASVAAADIDAGVAVSVDVPGVNDSGSGPRGLVADSRAGADFFGHLIALQDHLRAGDTAAIAETDRAALLRDEENLIHHQGSSGVMQARLAAALAQTESRALALKQQVSDEVDADLTQTIVQLSEVQTAYQAALQSGAGILQVSLMDYLR